MSLDNFHKQVKERMKGLIVKWIIDEKPVDKNDKEAIRAVKEDAERIVESQVTCGHVKPLLHASTLYGLRAGLLDRNSAEVQRAMDRSGDMIESMYRLLRQPNRHALEDIMSGLRVRHGCLCSLLFRPYTAAIAAALPLRKSRPKPEGVHLLHAKHMLPNLPSNHIHELRTFSFVFVAVVRF